MPQLPLVLLSTWGAWAVFISVLATQLGVPIPAAPMLILAGSIVAAGLASFWSMLGAAVLAVLIADCLWFAAGRLYGRRFLNSMVRYSLSLDATLRIARTWFERYGAPLLAISKFVPGLGLVSSPLLGTTAIDVRIFALWDTVGAVAWASFWILGGATLRSEISMLLMYVAAHGGTVLDVLACVAAAVVLYRWGRRVYFRRWLAKYRINPDELDSLMRSSSPPVIFDARPAEVRRKEAYRIAGAIPLDLESAAQVDRMLLEHEIVVYCVCPNEATAKHIVDRLRKKGFRNVRPLKGGLDAWQKRGFMVEPIPALDGFGAVAAKARQAAARDEHEPGPDDFEVETIRAVAPK